MLNIGRMLHFCVFAFLCICIFVCIFVVIFVDEIDMRPRRNWPVVNFWSGIWDLKWIDFKFSFSLEIWRFEISEITSDHTDQSVLCKGLCKGKIEYLCYLFDCILLCLFAHHSHYSVILIVYSKLRIFVKDAVQSDLRMCTK
jgi:hypothetical protein